MSQRSTKECILQTFWNVWLSYQGGSAAQVRCSLYVLRSVHGFPRASSGIYVAILEAQSTLVLSLYHLLQRVGRWGSRFRKMAA